MNLYRLKLTAAALCMGIWMSGCGQAGAAEAAGEAHQTVEPDSGKTAEPGRKRATGRLGRVRSVRRAGRHGRVRSVRRAGRHGRARSIRRTGKPQRVRKLRGDGLGGKLFVGYRAMGGGFRGRYFSACDSV